MKKYLLLILILVFSITMAACDEDNRNDKENKSSKDNIFADIFQKNNEEIIDENIDEVIVNSSEESTEVMEVNESNWVEFDECFYGEYSQQLPFEDGIDANGNTIWGMHDSYLKITKDYIYIDIPEGKYELTPDNSRLIGDEYLSVFPIDEMAEEWRFIFHNKENLQAGYLYISMQTATNQYTLYKD